MKVVIQLPTWSQVLTGADAARSGGKIRINNPQKLLNYPASTYPILGLLWTAAMWTERFNLWAIPDRNGDSAALPYDVHQQLLTRKSPVARCRASATGLGYLATLGPCHEM